MIATSLNTNILHMPKCAGSSIRWALYEHKEIQVFWTVPHVSPKVAPVEYKHWPSVGFIRNPLDWYPAWYNQKLRDRNRGLFNANLTSVLSNKFTESFDTFMTNALHLSEFFANSHNIQKLKNQILDNVMRLQCPWASLIWPNIENIKFNQGNFTEISTLFDWWFKQAGLNKAKVYRVEDNVQAKLNFAFPNLKSGLKIPYMNARTTLEKEGVKLSLQQQRCVREADTQYFNMFNY